MSILERVVKEGVTYYTIKVCKSYDETQVNTINRRYNDFFMLNNALAASGFTSLPSLPPKTLFGPSLNDLNVRQGGLEGYCRGLIERKDLRNSRQVKAFLDLEQFCPEIIYQTPQLLGIVSQKKNRYTTHCEFIARQNIFVTAQFDRTARQSIFEIFSFKSVGKVSDRFLLRSPSEFEDNRDSSMSGRMSLFQVNGNNDGQVEANIE